ncbi:hypothetical protein C8F01DRAFT_561775 [Mycena amicta]|nr:hypothetical protein C8F01DRAFT_561775 [Mycena amicta]
MDARRLDVADTRDHFSRAVPSLRLRCLPPMRDGILPMLSYLASLNPDWSMRTLAPPPGPRARGAAPSRAITFISALAKQNQIACEAALLCGFLEMLLLTASQLGDMNQEDEDRDALNSAFTALHQSATRIEHSDSNLADLWHSRLEAFWPAEVHPPSTAFEVAAHVTKTAPHTWLAIEAEFLQREAACLLRQSSPPRCPMHAGRTLSDASPFPRMSNMTLSNSAVPEMRWKDVLEAGFAASRALWSYGVRRAGRRRPCTNVGTSPNADT